MTPSGIPAPIAFEFERLAIDLAKRGFGHYSADAILHHIRWHEHVEKNNREFKCNNNWTATLARWAMARNPAILRGFFSLRYSREENTL